MKIKFKYFLYLAITILFTLIVCNNVTAEVLDLSPEIVLINGKVVTVDKDFSIVEAVAIKGNKIVGVGSNEEIKAIIGPKTEVIDLEGKTVTPGFIDGHAHMDREGLKFVYPSLTTTGYLLDPALETVEEIVEFIGKEVKKKKPGEWVITMPIGQYPYYREIPDAMAKTGFPTRWDLDKVSPDNPVYIRHNWYYWRGVPPMVSIVNSKALELAGITKDTLPPHPGVQIVKDHLTGEPTGVILEWGVTDTIEFSLLKVAPRFTHEIRKDALKLSMQRYNAVGTTSVYEGHGMGPEEIRVFKDLWAEGGITVRSYLSISPPWAAVPQSDVNEVLRDWAAYATGIGFGDDMLKLGDMRTELGVSPAIAVRITQRPYTAWAGYGVDQPLPTDRGLTINEYITTLAKNDIRVTGGGALLKNMIEVSETGEIDNIPSRRWVIQHVDGFTEEELDKVKELGIVVTAIINKKIGTVAGIESRSESYWNITNPLQSFVEKGIPFSLCTDNVPIEPMTIFQTAVTRKHRPTGKILGPEQRISREDAIKGFTIHGAYLTFEEDIKGSLEVGKLADIVVWSQDILTCPEDDLDKTEALLTIFDGKIVHRK